MLPRSLRRSSRWTLQTQAIEPGSTTTFSSAGDTWRAQNVDMSGNYNIDALFTITNTFGTQPSNVAFVTESARGNNMRVRVGASPQVTTAHVFITIQFVDAGTTNPFTGWLPGAQLITQFSDLDSDIPADRTDFGGVAQLTYADRFTSDDITPGSSELLFDSTSVPGFDIARLQEPWGPQGNVTATDALSQSPVTAAFLFDATSTLNIVVGQISNGPTGNRHIDIDMTPDFEIIPEPSTYAAILGALALGVVFYRRRRS